MFRLLSITILLVLAGFSQAADRPPNIIFIMADDLGCFELGCYGQKKIKTPNLDAIAKGGMKFDRFYAGNAVCAPSRCALMTGKHMGHATIRNNQEVKPEGQHPILKTDKCLPEYLKEKGYATGCIGKWGLGMFDSDGSPLKHGFDMFYGYNCQRHAHSHFPKYLYANDKRIELPGNDIKSGDTFSHDLMEKQALEFIGANKEKPFFLYVPFTVPHVAVQVPEDSLNEYKGKLGDDPAYDGKKGYQPHPAPHAAYAAMVTRLDRSVGRIMDEVKKLKLEGNTYVFFTSDNGPTHNVGGADSTFFESAGNLHGLKGSLYEGGIRVPMLAYCPGKIPANVTYNFPFYFPDVLPTVCELAGVEVPKNIDGISFTAALKGQRGQAQHEFLYWEFSGYGGQQAVIAGDYKAVRQKMGTQKIKTELYHLKTDMAESKDLAEKEPEMLKKLEKIMEQQHVPSKDFPLQAVDKK